MFRCCKLCQKVSNFSVIRIRKYCKSVANEFREINEEFLNPGEKQEPKQRIAIITCKNKTFNFYKGDTFSKFKPIPLACIGWRRNKSNGDHFFIHPHETIERKKEDSVEEAPKTFEDYHIHPELCTKLQEHRINNPLEIQKLAIPKVMSGQNVVIAAETGCGKTYAYLLPLLTQIINWKHLTSRGYNSPLGLIVTPSRELAVQIGLLAIKLSKRLGVTTNIYIGGRTKKLLINPPVSDVDLIVASFGVISKLSSARIVKLTFIRHVVLEEADALFHETFETKLKIFLNRIPIGSSHVLEETGMPRYAQLSLTSATMPARMSEIVSHVVNEESIQPVTTPKLHKILILQKFVRLLKSKKPVELLKYIKPKVRNKESVIIFTNRSSTCNWVSLFLTESSIPNVNMHGDMPKKIRSKQFANFISGRVNVLSTTNSGSRGLDTTMVKHILNYEFPLDTSDYIHRCGRTGRVGSPNDCRVTNFISTEMEIALVRKIEKEVRRGRPIPIFSMKQKGEPDESIPFIDNYNEYNDYNDYNSDKEDSTAYEDTKTEDNIMY